MDLPSTSFNASVVISEKGKGGGWLLLLLIQSAAQGPQKRHKPVDNGGIRLRESSCFMDERLNSHILYLSLSLRCCSALRNDEIGYQSP